MLRINLFGKLDIRYSDDEFRGCNSLKSRELFAYLLLNRDRPHAREKVASLLWGDRCTTAQSKKYLRNALWQLQSALNKQPKLAQSELLLVEPDWVRLNSVSMLQLDVEVFETAYAAVEGVSGYSLTDHRARRLDRALQLYRGDLLESWYRGWCLYEREQMLQIYLIMLDKMMVYREARRQFEKGLACGRSILRYDRARECTHRRMMRLYYLAGDRSTALRQYEQCEAVLREELDVEPSQRTTALYRQLRADHLETISAFQREQTEMEDAVRLLQSLQASLEEVRQRVQRTAETIGTVIRSQ